MFQAVNYFVYLKRPRSYACLYPQAVVVEDEQLPEALTPNILVKLIVAKALPS